MAKGLSDKELLRIAMEQTAQLMDKHTDAEIRAFLDGRGRLEVVPVKPAGKHHRK
jgi:hypothetical protein